MRAIVCLLLVLFMLAGSPSPAHAAKPAYDPVVRMLDTSRDPAERLKAMDLARQTRRDDPARLAALHRLVWDRGHPVEMRKLAIDQLIELDEAGFKQALAKRIVLIQNWDVLQHLLDTAVSRGWVDMTPTLVRQYARPATAYTDDQRPERATLLTLNPGRSIEQIVFDVFADERDQVEVTQQVGAWELLNRLTPPQRLMELLSAAPDSSPLVIDLKATLRDLGVMPTNREGILWMSHLRDPSQQNFWTAARDAVARLSAAQRQGLDLRHLPVLLTCDPTWLPMERDALLARARAAFVGGEHYTNGPEFDGPMRDYPQLFNESADQLAWADLLAILTLHRAVTQPDVVRALFEQAEADRRDPGSEHGGLIRIKPSAAQAAATVEARAYPALMRHHDRKFIPPDDMIRDMYTALAHYHFHAQDYRSRDWAGPGTGDLKLAKRLNCTGMVFTFIDQRTLNVDYYQPNGAVIDLGVIRR